MAFFFSFSSLTLTLKNKMLEKMRLFYRTFKHCLVKLLLLSSSLIVLFLVVVSNTKGEKRSSLWKRVRKLLEKMKASTHATCTIQF